MSGWGLIYVCVYVGLRSWFGLFFFSSVLFSFGAPFSFIKKRTEFYEYCAPHNADAEGCLHRETTNRNIDRVHCVSGQIVPVPVSCLQRLTLVAFDNLTISPLDQLVSK